jgi:hypothetical protein
MKAKQNKMTKEELVKLLVENFKTEDGLVDLSELDFTNEDIEGVTISRMQVNGYLNQSRHNVSGTLSQYNSKVGGNLWQGGHRVDGIYVGG